MRALVPWVLCLSASTFACGDTAVATIRIDLKSDGSGTLVTSSLLVPEAAGQLEQAVNGAEWQSRANLYCAGGKFQKIDELEVADLSFSSGSTDADFEFLRVTLPRGRVAKWPGLMLPTRPQRQDAQRTFDPRGDFANAASHVMLEVDIPGIVISHDVNPRLIGVQSNLQGKRVTLTLPIDHAHLSGDPLVWLITWR